MSQSSSEHPRPEFSQHLRSLLEQRGWSQNELAKRSKIDKGTMSRLMKGRSLTHENVQRLAGALELSPQALLQEGPWPSPPATHEAGCDETYELVERAAREQPRAPEVKKTSQADQVSQAEQIAQLQARITKLERKLKLSDDHCERTENQNVEFCRQLYAYEQDIAALTTQRDQAIAEREQALAWLRAAQQEAQKDQAASRVVDAVLAILGGTAAGAGVTGVLCKGKMDRLEQENKYWKDHAAFLQRELEEERRRRGAVAQQGAQLQAPTLSESSAAPVPQGVQATDPQTTEPKVLALEPIKFDFSSLEGQFKQILAPSAPQGQGAPRPSEGNG